MKKILCISCPRAEANARAFAATERQLIDWALFECNMGGSESLLERAGIDEISFYHLETDETESWLSRAWEDGEELATAIEVIRESGIFLTFDATDPQDRLLFVLEADSRGCGDQARACLEGIAE